MTPNFVWREKVVQWCYDVVDSLQEDRSIVYVSMNILDRYCAFLLNETGVDEATYELASLTAMFLAVRIAGSGNLQLPDLIDMSRGGIGVKDVVSMGKCMIGTLNWDRRIVRPSDFLSDLLALVPSLKDRRQYFLDSACYLAEIAVFDMVLSRYAPSQVALAAVLNALETKASSLETATFCEAVEAVTGMSCTSKTIQFLSARLGSVHNQGPDSPHLVPEEADLAPRTYHSLPSLAGDVHMVEKDYAAPTPTKKQSHSTPCYLDTTTQEILPPLKRTKRNLAEVL